MRIQQVAVLMSFLCNPAVAGVSRCASSAIFFFNRLALDHDWRGQSKNKNKSAACDNVCNSTAVNTRFHPNQYYQKGPFITHCQKANRTSNLEIWGNFVHEKCTCNAVWVIKSVRLHHPRSDCSPLALWGRLAHLLGPGWRPNMLHEEAVNRSYTTDGIVKKCTDS